MTGTLCLEEDESKTQENQAYGDGGSSTVSARALTTRQRDPAIRVFHSWLRYYTLCLQGVSGDSSDNRAEQKPPVPEPTLVYTIQSLFFLPK